MTNSGQDDFFISKISSTGLFLWTKAGGGIGSDYAEGVSVDSGGNSYLVGYFNNRANFGTTTLTNR